MISKPLPNTGWKFLYETETSLIYQQFTSNDQDINIKGLDMRNRFDKATGKYVDITKRGANYLVLDKELLNREQELNRLKNKGKH